MTERPKRQRSQPRSKEVDVEQLQQTTSQLQRKINRTDYALYQAEKQDLQWRAEGSDALKTLDNHAAGLEDERVQLLKRLNMVLMEVDRLSEEKCEMQNDLQEERLKVEELERRLQHTGKVLNVVDRNMQTELKHEREENLKLKSLLQSREEECTVIRAKLKEVDLSSSHVSGTNTDLSGKLQNKLDHLSLMENDRRNLIDKIAIAKRQIAVFETDHSSLLQDRARMKEVLGRTEEERGDVSMRVAEQQANFEELVQIAGSEKEKMVWLHRKHSRLLGSHNIAQSLRALRSRVLTQHLVALKAKLQYSQARDRTCLKLEWVVFRHRNARTKQTLDLWRSSLNWKDTHASRVRAGEQLFNFMKAKTAYKTWRKVYLCRKGARMRNTAGLKNIFLLAEASSLRMKQRGFGHWRQLVDQLHARCRTMAQTLLDMGQLTIRQAMFKWKSRVLTTRILENQAELAHAHSVVLVEQAQLHSDNLDALCASLDQSYTMREQHFGDQLYKRNLRYEEARATQSKDIQQAQVKAVLLRFNATHLSRGFSKWKAEIHDAKQCENVDALITKYRRHDDSSRLKKVFLAWKAFHFQAKLDSYNSALEVERPIVAQLEEDIKITQELTQNKGTLKLTRAVAKRMLSGLHSYFAQWKLAVPHFHRGAGLCKRMIVYCYKRKLRDAWRAWQTGAKDVEILELLERNETVTGDSAVLQEHVDNLEAALAEKDDEKQEVSVRRLRRATKLFANKLMADSLRQWARNALNQSNFDIGGTRLEGFVRQWWLRNSFNDLKATALKLRHSQLCADRLLRKQQKTARQLQRTTLDAWKAHSASVKAVKRIMISSFNRALRNSTARRFEDWKLVLERQQKLQNAGLETEMLSHKAHLNSVLVSRKQALKTAESSNAAKTQGLSAQATARLYNALLRSQDTSLGKLFHRWVDSAHLMSRQIQRTRRLKQLWKKARLRAGFRSWMVYRDLKERALATEVFNERIKQKRETQRQLKAAKAELDDAHEATDTSVQAAEHELWKTRERLQFMLKKAVQASDSQYASNKLEFIFSRWRERYRQDKAKLTAFVKVSQRIVLAKAMHKIRLDILDKAQRSKIDALLIRNFKHYASRTTQGAFDKWRSNSLRLKLQKAQESRGIVERSQGEMQNLFDAVHKAGRDRAYKAVTGRTKHRIMQTWSKISKKLKAVNHATSVMVPTVVAMRRTWALSQWEDRMKTAKARHRKCLLAIGFSHKSLMGRGFSGLRQNHAVTHFMGTVLANTGMKLYLSSLNSGLHALKTYTSNHKTETDWSNFTIMSRLRRLAGRICQKLNVEAFYHWKAQCELMKKSIAVKRRVVLRGLHRKLRAGIRAWREGLVSQDAIYFAENEGDVAIDNSIKRGRLAVLEGILRDSGIDSGHLEKLLLEREDIEVTLARKNLLRPTQMAGYDPGDEVIITSSPFSGAKGRAKSPTRSPSRSLSRLEDRSPITTSPSKMTRVSRKPLKGGRSGNLRSASRASATPSASRVSFEEPDDFGSPRNFTEAAYPLKSQTPSEMSPSSSYRASSKVPLPRSGSISSPIKLVRVQSSQDEDPLRLMARMLVRWKSTVAKRRRFRRAAHRMLAFRKNSSAMWGFLKWKQNLPLTGAVTKNMSRADLYKLLAKLDRDIHSLEGLINATSNRVYHLEGQSVHLEQNTRRSQNQALSALTLRCLNETALAFVRWRLNASRMTVIELVSLLQGFEDKLYVLHDEYCHMEAENKALSDENMELRQASIDGIAIADAVEALSRERERLSTDLQSRAQTIKKLLEENSELTLRLRYIRDPERELPRTGY